MIFRHIQLTPCNNIPIRPHTLCRFLLITPPRRLLTAGVGLSNSSSLGSTSSPKCLKAKTTVQEVGKDQGTRQTTRTSSTIQRSPGSIRQLRSLFCPDRNRRPLLHLLAWKKVCMQRGSRGVSLFDTVTFLAQSRLAGAPRSRSRDCTCRLPMTR